MKPQILKRYTDIENGIESRLLKTERGFVVGVWDIDCNEPFGEVIIFPHHKENCQQEANDYFIKINSNDYNISVRIL